MISIAELERRVDEARKGNDQFKAKILELKDQGLVLDKQKEDRRIDKNAIVEVQRELNLKIDAHKKFKLTLESAHKWGLRTLTKLDKVFVTNLFNS